ncbi:hypothetical protein [Nocardia tengchongensis]|uniref:hypothetical protein n=1 Tax=Nocardia tengchongensis TaxID=2055889 RepID=UPI003666227F
MTDESLATQVRRVWIGSRKARERIAAGLAIPGALLWAMQALGAWIQSQEGKWQNTAYLSAGDSTITADNLLALLGVAFSTSAPANLVFATPLVIFPVATIACLLNSGCREN